MSTKALFWALKSKVGNPYQKLILISLADISNEHRQCWPSHQYLAERAECHRTTVIRHLEALKDRGFISITHRVDQGGLKSSNVYTLKCPDVAESDIDVAESDKGSSRARHNTPIDTPIYINRAAWEEWVEYRRQLKKKITSATATKQWKLLSQFNQEIQQDIINTAIQQGWQGLYPPKEKTNGSYRQDNIEREKLSGAERTRRAREAARAREHSH